MARIESDSEHSLQLDIVGYQFPAGERCETDANWLVAELAVAYDDKRWRAREPALLTSEVTALIEWLRHVAVGDAVGGFGAIEPNLSFGAVPDGDAILLSAHFCLEFCRRELDYDQRVEGESLEYRLSPEDVRRFAGELEREGAKFPERAASMWADVPGNRARAEGRQ